MKLKPYKILLLTSDRKFADSVKLLSAKFNRKNCKINWKKSAESALKTVKFDKYDVSIIDSEFGKSPEKLEFLHKIVSSNNYPPILFLIDEENDSLRIDALRKGASFCLNKKKLDVDILEKGVDYAIERRESLLKIGGNLVRFRQLIETLPVMMFVAEPTPPYAPIYLSPEFETFGFPLEEWKKQANFWDQRIHQDDRQRVLEGISAAVESDKKIDLQYRIIDQKGDVRWVHDLGYFVRAEDGKLVCWQGVLSDITETKNAENELLTLFQSMTDVILVLDADGRYLKIAPTTTSLLYRPPNDLLGKMLHEVFPVEHADWFLDKVRSALETGQTQQFEYILPIGEQNLWFSATATPMSEKSVILVARDVSEKKLAEEELKESEERYRNLYENANDLIYVTDLDGKILSNNKATEKVIGYSQEESSKMNIQDIFAPESLDTVLQMIVEKLAGKPHTFYEADVIAKDGRRITLEVNSSLIFGKDGQPTAIQGIARDITERKEAEIIQDRNEAELKDLFDNAPLGYHELDNKGRIVRVNQSELELLGYESDEMLGQYVWEFVVEKISRESVLAKLGGKKVLAPHERNFKKKDGSKICVLLSDRLIKDEKGEIVGIRTTMQNITELKKAEEALIASEEKYRLMGEGIAHQIWTADAQGNLNYANQRVTDYFGITVEEFIQSFSFLIHPEEFKIATDKWINSLKTGEDYICEYRLRRHDGEYRWFYGRAAAGRDADGNIIGWFGTSTDIQDRKQAESQLTYLAEHDTLTGLANRARFIKHLERSIQRNRFNSEFNFAVLFLDLDRFKVVNDSLGHFIGDKLLVETARRIESCLRPNDLVARLGGDEFTVLLTNIKDANEAARIAGRFLDSLSAPFTLDKYEVFTTASIGIIVSDNVKRQPEDFLRDADTAMYRAKSSGKSRYEIFDREMHIRNMNLLQVENDLRRAVDREEFRVFFQPIIDLKTGEIIEFEALSRWQHPTHGLVFPDQFIGIAEETGLIIPIGKLVLEESCRQTARWQKRFPQHKNLSISVNLSAKQLMHPNLMTQISQSLEKNKLASKHLKLEVTESMMMEHSEKSLPIIEQLNKLGIELSTDDFGTGYSSLSYLHKFPFNRLKIDRSFVGRMDEDEKSEAIVRTILLLAQNLKIEVVAEGIETESQLKRLCQLGCEAGQGYLFSKPVPAEIASNLLENGFEQIDCFSIGNPNEILEHSQIQ